MYVKINTGVTFRCYMLYIIGYMLYVRCYMIYVRCYMLYDLGYMLYVICHIVYVICYMLYVIGKHTKYGICYMLYMQITLSHTQISLSLRLRCLSQTQGDVSRSMSLKQEISISDT